MNLSDRATKIKGIFYTHCKTIVDVQPSFDVTPSKKHPGTGTIEEEIKFIDGSLLNFFELIKGGNIGIYSYLYIRPDTGFFFHYQNEGIQKGIKKPLHHLHVGIMKDYFDKKMLEMLPKELIEHNGPHYMAPEIDFFNLMGLIVANFFIEHRDCVKMLTNLGCK